MSDAARPPRPRWVRVAAAALAVLFAFTVISTTVFSIGRYCLTSDGADTRGLLRPVAADSSP